MSNIQRNSLLKLKAELKEYWNEYAQQSLPFIINIITPPPAQYKPEQIQEDVTDLDNIRFTINQMLNLISKQQKYINNLENEFLR